MVLVVFARIGWMARYNGPQPGDEKPIGGGSYNKTELGNEAFNFKPLHGQMLGFFQHQSSIALERIKADFSGEKLTGVLAVFIATDPKRGSQRIVGWYPKATVYRHLQSSNEKSRDSFSYFLEVPAKCAVLIPKSGREFIVPGGKEGFGQANVCYALDVNGHPKNRAQWIASALEYIDSYERENVAQQPESELDADNVQQLESTIEQAAGFQSNPRIRQAIEKYSMDWAEKSLHKFSGNKPTDTHKNKPYDFLCKVSGGELFVEVKGTQTSGNSVSLSPNEVAHARKHKNSALLIVHSVKVKGKRNPIVSGGKERFLHPWNISTGKLKPSGYLFTLNKADGG